MRMQRCKTPALGLIAVLLFAASPAFGQKTAGPATAPEPVKLELPKILTLPGVSPVGTAEPSAAPARARNERALFEAAASYLDEGANATAAETLQEFIRLYPRSFLAAEATYRLSLAYLLLGREDEARTLHERLVRDYPDSPWARLVLRTHFGKEQLRTLADEKRLRAKESRADARAAVDLYKLLLKRFDADEKDKLAAAYRQAVCAELDGDLLNSRKLFELIGEKDKDGVWGRLSRFRTGDAKAFEDGMADLVELSGEGEQYHTFFDLADRFAKELSCEERVRCEFLRGLCLARLKRHGEAVAVWRKVLAERPESAWAPECAFWLAEEYYRRKEIARAADEYRNLLRKYPGSARAALARRWAEALPGYDENWAGLERCLTAACKKLTGEEVPFCAELAFTSGDTPPSSRCRVAFQDRSHYLLHVAYRGSEFILLANDEGGRFRAPGDAFVLATPRGAAFPLPRSKLSFDPATGTFSYNFASVDGARGPLFEVSPDYVAAQLSEWQVSFHVRRLDRALSGERRVVYQLEMAPLRSAESGTCDVEVDARGSVRAVRLGCVEDGQLLTLALSDIRIGEPLPDGALAGALPPGVEERQVPELNTVEVVGKLCQAYGRLAANPKALIRETP
jgi:TolA-binding protein